ncbi:hypothetical protein [Vibrio quintilis]|uniref:Uncharacterized protein n=1 Tax=Vibrio quintilis TaxID=1117707 RepID=A0A1M7Z1J3_9VIBR|nr:hypothetical protein [Vibrio quintilis]SHO58650.1 hypothetical protein VQ7734_04422 [Vibrio quintilis]
MKLPMQSQPVERTVYSSHAAGAGAEACGFWGDLGSGLLSAAKTFGPTLLGML